MKILFAFYYVIFQITLQAVAPNCGQVRAGSLDNSSLHHVFSCLPLEAGGGCILWVMK